MPPESNAKQAKANAEPASQAVKPATKTKRPPAAPSFKSYEDNALDEQAIQEAVESVPIKDYSDYEIAIEAKDQDHYSDALFGNEDELEQALNNDKPEQQVELPAAKTEQPEQAEPRQQNPASGETKLDTDYSRFHTANSTALGDAGIGPLTGIVSVISNTINGSQADLVANYEEFIPAAVTPVALASDDRSANTANLRPQDSGQKQSASLRERIQLKARATLAHSKQGLDEYLGRSLPDREMPLDFSLAVQRSKKDFEHLVTGYDIKKLFENKAKSIHSIFSQTNKDLADLIKCQLSSSNRLSLLDTYSSYLAERYTEVFAMLEKKLSMSGDSKRLELMANSSAVLKHLIGGYKQVYASYYEGSNVNYGTHRKTAHQVAIRLLDVLLMEQRLASCLHTALSQSSVKTANKLLVATYLYEPDLLQQLHRSEALGREVTLQAMFVRYQLGLFVKTDSLSSSLYKVFAAYLLSQLEDFSILVDSEHKNLAGPVLSITHEQTEGPEFLNEPPVPGVESIPALLIPLGGFLNRLNQDYRQVLACLEQQSTHSSPVFGKIKLPYAVTVLSVMTRVVAKRVAGKTDPVFSIYQPTKLKMYCGLDECHAAFDHQYALYTRKPAKKGEPTPDLPPKPVPNKTPVLCAREDNGKLYLQIAEDKSTKPVDIGQLLLLNGEMRPEQQDELDSSEDQDKQERTLLAQVIRLERSLPGKLNMVVEIIAEDASAIRLSARPEKVNKALIARGNNQSWLITQHNGQPFSELSLPIQFLDGSRRAINIAGFATLGSKIQSMLIE